MAENGAAATNQSSQEMVVPNCFSMKEIATMFCAAAVLMPTFHRLSACAVAIISIPAKRLFSGTSKAMMMPMTIGTMQETRAVVLGTKKLSKKPTMITPISTRLVFAPTLDNTSRAMRLSRPVRVIAAARNSAPPTSAQAVLLKPPRAMPNALLVAILAAGFSAIGA